MRKLSISDIQQVHAENSNIINLITTRLAAAGHNTPFFHSISRPQIAESGATYRIISLATLIDASILIVHMSSGITAERPKPGCSPSTPRLAHNTSSSSQKA